MAITVIGVTPVINGTGLILATYFISKGFVTFDNFIGNLGIEKVYLHETSIGKYLKNKIFQRRNDW